MNPFSRKYARRPGQKKKILKGIGIAFLALFLLGAVFCIILLNSALKTLPDINTIDASPKEYLTTVLDKDGQVLTTLAGEGSNRIYVTLDKIPENLQKAFVAIEDTRFYTHQGIDIKGILRAAFKGITSGHFSEGASTITQQLLKNNVLTTWTEEKAFKDKLIRKLQEQILAVQLEKRYSKEWILENYLNTINLGSGCWGVEAASRCYFGKDVSELTLAESALIAGITRNPSGYSPLQHPDACQDRQKLVLSKMLEAEYISQEEYDSALAEPVFESITEHETTPRNSVFSWFEDALLTQVCDDIAASLSCTENEAWQLIYSGGLTIESTTDDDLQKICEKVINDNQYYSSEAQASLVMMDYHTGAVLALVGGRGEKTASLTYNRAIDSVRQPGSTFKVIGEYAAALEAKMVTLGTAVDDAPYSYSDSTEIHNSNEKYNGMTTVRQAIANSTNTIAVKVMQDIGLNDTYDQLLKFGFSHLTEADRVESLALGGTHNGVTNLELTSAYAAVANDGKYIKPIYYTRVLDQDGQVLLENKTKKTQVISKDTANLLTWAMESVITEGTGTGLDIDRVQLAGKSGTSSDLKDLWFVGYSPLYACGIWGGFDNNQAQTDSSYVKSLWHEVMKEVHYGEGISNLLTDSTLTSCTICSKCGKLAVSGLCSDTVQGDMTREEMYIPGTEPTESCDCHEKVTICSASGDRAGSYCPKSSLVNTVYLKTATAGTEDEAYALSSDILADTCHVHKNWWDSITGSSGSDSSDSNSSGANSSGSDSSGSDSSDSDSSDSDSSDFTKWLEGLFN
jgi:penicillin-binding protein 1A